MLPIFGNELFENKKFTHLEDSQNVCDQIYVHEGVFDGADEEMNASLSNPLVVVV